MSIFDYLKSKTQFRTNDQELETQEAIEKNDSLYMKMLNGFIKVKIDTSNLSDLKWYEYRLPKTNELGYITYIDVDSLEKTQHQLEFRIYRYNEKRDNFNRWAKSTIPFWKE